MAKLTESGKQALDNLFARASQEKKIPGFVFGASNLDGEIYFNATGFKVIDDPNSGEITPDSVYWICSQTKFIVHLAALRLIEQEKLGKETPVSDFFPEFATPVILDDILSPSPSFRPASSPILVKHLLNFSSGLFYPPFPDPTRNLPPAYTNSYKDAEDPFAEFFRLLKGDYPGIPIKFEPGTDFAYGYSADVLGFIVEKIVGKTMEEHLQETIFGPLGMGSSFFRTPKIIEKEITMSYREADGTLVPWNNQLKLIERDPQNDGKISTGIISQETAKELFVPTLTEAGSKSLDLFTRIFPGGQWSVGLAVCSLDWPKRRKRGTAFWSGWAGSYFFIDPDTGISVVFGTQLAPSRDPEVIKLFGQLEETLYAGLEA
ncbi:Acyltransferase calJ [Psilocybe cubensis]|uniref:Acyltransferase calJ n=1 Tax=Psilocybe cubensis TaxID=181762 RepID=A0ACB8GGR4_PSICU|nr:Acyltransferase calJ [Psilocybe cubensis]KAH9474873.1 Acyltransferase calJ [Psilocybe cubensis]